MAAGLAAAVCVPASAAAQSPQDFSAADQYVETLPTPSGPSATKDGRRGKTPLRPSVAAKLRLEGGADAARLEEVATSSDFGAPQGKAAGADKQNGADRRTSRDRTAVPSASVQAVRSGGADLLWLLLALLAITGLMVGAVTYRRHKDKDTT